ncbi:tripartite motif-containing protein 2-like [Anneissia japonica]|uniref:tripartite motif-containing protein 2-like n=1 Tax=Anneissia japonica TaxID=1529436 RepID=UPI0014254EF2|nr:tripartite motif-containing protein 2-like [Anneissia japonica]
MLASTVIDDLDDQVLECAVCMKRLREPKTLPCLHSFCRSCLADWIEKKQQPVCPTCLETFEAPSGGLQSIPPNTIINNLLEYVHHLEDNEAKCSYCKLIAVKFCKDCTQYFCIECVKSHSTVDILKLHTIFSLEELRSLTPEQQGILKPSLCKTHMTQSLKFYCNSCNVPVCVECTVIEHKKCHSEDNVIQISDAFNEFKKNASELLNRGEEYELKLQERKSEMQKRLHQFEMERSFCESRINRAVDKAIRKLECNREQLKLSLKGIHDEKTLKINEHIQEMDSSIKDLSHRKKVVSMSMRCPDLGAVMESQDQVLEKLKSTIESAPVVPRDGIDTYNTVLHFQQIFHEIEFGYVSQTDDLHKVFEIENNGKVNVTKDQPFDVKITAPVPDKEDEIFAELKAQSGEEVLAKVEYLGQGKYKAECRCPESGMWMLHVSLNGVNISGSPMHISVEIEGLVRVIDDFAIHKTDNKQGKVTDVMVDKEGYLLVSSSSQEVLRFDQKTGKYVDKIIMPPGATVYTMCGIGTDDYIIYSDNRNKCVTICQKDGTTVRSIGKGVITFAVGLALDEVTRVLYVVDREAHCVLKFNVETGEMIEKMGLNGEGVGFFNRPYHVVIIEDKVAVTDCRNNRIQILDKVTNVWEVLIKDTDNDRSLKCPLGIVNDKDGNIIVSGNRRLLMFDRNGVLLKRLDTYTDELQVPIGLAITSYRPRSVAVANYKANNIKIYNY